MSEIKENMPNSAFHSVGKTTRKLMISVEGNISSGKSTLVQALCEHYAAREDEICFLQEPVKQWKEIQDADGNDMITKYYNNIKHYSFAFQMMAYISRLDLLRKALKGRAKIIVCERSVYTDRYIFAQMLKDSNMIEDVEFAIYLRWFNAFLDDMPPLKVFYVQTDPEIALHRLKKRNRKGEEDVDLEYLKNCHKYHENWLSNRNAFLESDGKIIGTSEIVNGNVPLDAKETPFTKLKHYIDERLLTI